MAYIHLHAHINTAIKILNETIKFNCSELMIMICFAVYPIPLLLLPSWNCYHDLQAASCC